MNAFIYFNNLKNNFVDHVRVLYLYLGKYRRVLNLGRRGQGTGEEFERVMVEELVLHSPSHTKT